MSLSREEKKRRAIEKGKLLWKLVTTTAGVGDLAEPMRRVERNFAHLAKGQQITVVMIAQLFEEGINGINEEPKEGKSQTAGQTSGQVQGETSSTQAETKPEVVEAELINPGETSGPVPTGQDPKD
jgi:hypothetical protein